MKLSKTRHQKQSLECLIMNPNKSGYFLIVRKGAREKWRLLLTVAFQFHVLAFWLAASAQAQEENSLLLNSPLITAIGYSNEPQGNRGITEYSNDDRIYFFVKHPELGLGSEPNTLVRVRLKQLGEDGEIVARKAVNLEAQPNGYFVGSVGLNRFSEGKVTLTVLGSVKVDDAPNNPIFAHTSKILITAPILIGVPEDITIECDIPVPPPAMVTAIDPCGGDPLTVLFTEMKRGSCSLKLIRT